MKIKFFEIGKYGDVFKEYEYGKIIDLLKHKRNIYVYVDSLRAYLYDGENYIVHYQGTDYTEILDVISVCYELSRFEDDASIFTEKYLFNNEKSNI